MRIRIDLAYDGTDFHGWAAQPGLRTVEEELVGAAATVLRVEASVIRLTCAGRTDAGVHARGQVVHLDVAQTLVVAAGRTQDETPLRTLARRLNGVLPPDLRVHRVHEAPVGFDARFSALWRRYAYRVADDPAVIDPLRRHEVLPGSRPLDLAAMNRAGARLLGQRGLRGLLPPT